MRFGETIKRLREGARMSRSVLAERSGLSLRNVQNWEQDTRFPRRAALVALARALNVTVDALLVECARASKERSERLYSPIGREGSNCLCKVAPRSATSPRPCCLGKWPLHAIAAWRL